MISRRVFISGTGATLIGAGFGLRFARAETERAPDLMRVAADHVSLAEADRGRSRLWGRLGGSTTEMASARLFAKQIQHYIREAAMEPFSFSAFRPIRWSLALDGRSELLSAMPAPFDARFPDGNVRAQIVDVTQETDWRVARQKWALVQGTMQGSPARNSVREGNLYKRAVDAGAAGLIFSLPMKPGHWRAVAPVDKAYALRDEAYPDKRRPMPCFCIDAHDGEIVARSGEQSISAWVEYESRTRRQGLNVIAYLQGGGKSRVAIVTHLDSFFSGANDNASGLATTIGLAHRISRLPLKKRPADFYFVGLSAHHDGAEGLRAFVRRNPKRFASLDQAILIEHTDAQAGPEGEAAGWPPRLNDLRQAYLGNKGWPEVRRALPELVKITGLMNDTPPMQDACIGDLQVICDQLKSFCLIQAPPFYHTDHDTLDKISRAGMQASVQFHLRLLRVTGALAES